MEPTIDAWKKIAAFLQPNPVSYTTLSHVCKSSRAVFQSDALWRPLSPACIDNNFAKSFYERVSALSQDQRDTIKQLWLRILTYDHWSSEKSPLNVQINGNKDIALPWCVLVAARLFKSSDDWDDFGSDDFGSDDFDSEDEDEDVADDGEEDKDSELAGTLQLLLRDQSLAKAAVSLWGPVLQHVSDQSEEIVLLAVSNKHSLKWTSPETDGHGLRFAAEFHNNKKVVHEAIMNDPLSFEFADASLQKDPAFVRTLAQIDGRVLAFASKNIRANKEIVIEAIKSSGYGLAYASHQLKGNRDVVMAAVRTRGANLRDAVPRLKIDQEVIDAAIANDPEAEKYVPEDIEELKEMLGVKYLPSKKSVLEQLVENVKAKSANS